MKTKIVQVGHSLGVLLPRLVTRKLGMQKGDAVMLEADAHSGSVTIRVGSGGVDASFAREVKDFMHRYRTDLERLAK